MKPSPAIWAGVVVVALWASVFPAVRIAVPELGVLGLTTVRLVVGAVALLVLAPVLRVRLPRRRDLPVILACSFFGMFGYQLLLNCAETSIPAGTSSLIASASPIVSTAIAVLFFRERLSLVRIIGGAVAVAGIALVCLAQAALSVSGGTIIVIGAMILYGTYHPLVRPLYMHYSGMEVATYTLVSAALMSLPLVPFEITRFAHSDSDAWLSAIYLGLLPSAFAFVLWGYALSRLSVSISTSLIFLVPAFAILVSLVWLHEVPVPAEIAGGGVVLVGVVLIGRGDRTVARISKRFRSRRSPG